MPPPLAPAPLWGSIPVFAPGVKVAVIDATGKVLDTQTIYPFPPRNDVMGSQAAIQALIQKHGVQLIAIGNGTGSRETEKLVADLIERMPTPKPTKVIVSEAGASVYSASELAALEFPNLDVSLRGAVSIGPPPAGPLGRAGQDRAQGHRRRAIPA